MNCVNFVIRKHKLFMNILYSFKLLYATSKSREFHTILRQIAHYSISIFYSSFFMKFLVGALQGNYATERVIFYVVIVGIISLMLSAYIYYCDNVLLPVGDIAVFKNLYKMIYMKSESISLECFDNKEFYNDYAVALDDAGTKVIDVVVNAVRIVLGTVAGMVSFAIMFQINKYIILFVAGPLIGNFLIAPQLAKITHQKYLDGAKYKRRAEYVNRVMHLADFAKEIRLSSVFNVLKRDFVCAMENQSSLYKRYIGKEFPRGLLQYIFCYMVIFEGILLFGAYFAMESTNNKISFSNMVVLTSTMLFAAWIWLAVRDSINKCVENSLYIEKLRRFLGYEDGISENQEGIIPEGVVNSIEFRDVSFFYSDDKKVLKNINFYVDRNSTIALVGHNGAGKTTIIKLLMRLYDPTEGAIYVNGRNIKDYNLKAYRRLFSTAFQDFKIFSDTIRYNLLMGENYENEESRMIEALKAVGLYDKIKSFPNGLDTVLTKEFDDEGVVLSGGEMQKLAVARAYLRDACVAVFDEPSSALDPIAEFKLFESIVKFSANKIGVFISHRLSCVKDSDMVLMLENGEIIERGKHEELIGLNQKYAELYRIQESNYHAFNQEVFKENEIQS